MNRYSSEIANLNWMIFICLSPTGQTNEKESQRSFFLARATSSMGFTRISGMSGGVLKSPRRIITINQRALRVPN